MSLLITFFASRSFRINETSTLLPKELLLTQRARLGGGWSAGSTLRVNVDTPSSTTPLSLRQEAFTPFEFSIAKSFPTGYPIRCCSGLFKRESKRHPPSEWVTLVTGNNTLLEGPLSLSCLGLSNRRWGWDMEIIETNLWHRQTTKTCYRKL